MLPLSVRVDAVHRYTTIGMASINNSASSYISQDNVKNTVSSCLLIIVTLLRLGYEMI
jgi:hypothetical protein